MNKVKVKGKKPIEVWKQTPDDHDFPAAAEYLGLLFGDATAQALAEKLRSASTVSRKAKDLLRSSRLPLLSADDREVAKNFGRAASGRPLSPVLLVRSTSGRALIVADGYHRICASYHLSDDTEVQCRIVDFAEPA